MGEALNVGVVGHPVDPDEAPETEGEGDAECSPEKAGQILRLERVRRRVREESPNGRKQKAKEKQPDREPG